MVGKARKFSEDFVLGVNGEDIFKVMGTSPEKTILLYGPPGTGKTMCVHAINNSMNQGFYEARKKINKNTSDNEFEKIMKKLNFMCFSYDMRTYGTAYVNIGSRRVQTFFDKTKDVALEGTKVLVLLDEADGLLVSRGDTGSCREDFKVLETIMKNLQEIQEVPNMYCILTTNLVDICDDASLRAGRINRRYKFDLPNVEERERAFDYYINRINSQALYKVIRGVNPKDLAEKSEGLNYADIKQIVDSSINTRIFKLLKTNTEKITPVTYITGKTVEKELYSHKKKFKMKRKVGFGV